MKKIVAILGSPRKQETAKILSWVEDYFKTKNDVEFSTIFLPDQEIKMCKGCFACLSKGEEFCPLSHDQAISIFQHMLDADGVIFATPVYSLQVTAYMKNLLDRLAFVFHRPSMFHKTFMGIVTQGVYGEKKTLSYLNEVARFWGFRVNKGLTFTTPPNSLTKEDYEKMKTKTQNVSERFYLNILSDKMPVPTAFELFLFRMNRSIKPSIQQESPRDYEYFKQKGWLESDYFYPTSLSPFKILIGWLVDRFGAKIGKQIETKNKIIQNQRYSSFDSVGGN